MADETQMLPSGSPMAGKSPWLSELSARWLQGATPCVWEVLGTAELSTTELVEILTFDQAQHWKHHDPILVERYFERWPYLTEDISAALALIISEFELRKRLGQAPTCEEYIRRFPFCQDSIRLQLGTVPSQATILPSNPIPRSEETLLPAATPRGEETILNAAPSSPTHRDTLMGDPAPITSVAAVAEEVEFPQIPGYELVQELGRGGMGVVYKARQVRAGRDVALKVIRPDMLSLMPLDTQSNTVGRFRHEAKAAGRLLHDNIVTVYEVGEWNTYHYYAMRMVEGPSLIQLVRERPLENRLAAQFLAGTARGVQFAHDQGILHRDLKPHNVLIDSRTQRPLVADFGLAKFTADTDELTRAGDVIGTPSYMSPEQARDSSKVTSLSDVYSLGATLYHVLAGRPPFQAANLGETLRQILHEEPLPPRQLNPAIDPDLETICLKCLQKEPAKRYASCGDFADDLERYLRNEPILARPVSTSEKAFRWCKRNPALAGSMIAMLLLAIIAVTSIVVGYVKTEIARVKAKQEEEKAKVALLETLATIRETTTETSENTLLGQPGLQPLRKKLLQTALKHLQEFLNKEWDDPRIRFEVADATRLAGEIEQTIGDLKRSEELLKIAEDRLRSLLSETPLDPKVRLSLSNTLNAQAQCQVRLEQDELSLSTFQAALSIRSELVSEFSDDLEFLRKQANMHMNCGIAFMRNQKAELAFKEMRTGQSLRLELLQKSPQDEKLIYDAAKGAFGLAQFYYAKSIDSSSPEEHQNDINLANAELSEAIKFFEKLLAEQPKHVIYRFKLVNCLHLFAQNSPHPEEFYERGLQEITELVAENPKVDEYRMENASIAYEIRKYRESKGDHQAALVLFQEIDNCLQPILDTNLNALEFAALNQSDWAQALTMDRESQIKHAQKAIEYWQHFEKLYGKTNDSREQIGTLEQILNAPLDSIPEPQPNASTNPS